MSKKRLFSIGAVALAATVIATVSFSRGSRPILPQRQPLPPVLSIIKNLQVVSVREVYTGTPAAGVEVEIFNNSAKPVMAVDLVAGEGAITRNGLSDEENPIVVIEPFGTTTIMMSFGEMTPGAPLVVSAVTYADGSEEGDERSLRIMHKIRERNRAVMKAKREKQKGNITP